MRRLNPTGQSWIYSLYGQDFDQTANNRLYSDTLYNEFSWAASQLGTAYGVGLERDGLTRDGARPLSGPSGLLQTRGATLEPFRPLIGPSICALLLGRLAEWSTWRGGAGPMRAGTAQWSRARSGARLDR